MAISASGNTIPPMHIFPGVRFSYNPMDGSVPKAYFGRSVSGWINTELFYGWVKNHFAKWIGKERPVVLLLDGHTSHIDVETSKFCKQDNILLYCLPPHSSHITQPLDVGFFGPLKASWRRAVDTYRTTNVGMPVTKEVFARIFKQAWDDCVSVQIVVNGFRGAGIYPVDASKAGVKVCPLFIYQEDEKGTSESSTSYSKTQLPSPLLVLESELDEDTLRKYNKRLDEGYDLKEDLLYNVWVKLKKLEISRTENPIPDFETLSINAIQENINSP